jgi:hypothetical protein
LHLHAKRHVFVYIRKKQKKRVVCERPETKRERTLSHGFYSVVIMASDSASTLNANLEVGLVGEPTEAKKEGGSMEGGGIYVGDTTSNWSTKLCVNVTMCKDGVVALTFVGDVDKRAEVKQIRFRATPADEKCVSEQVLYIDNISPDAPQHTYDTALYAFPPPVVWKGGVWVRIETQNDRVLQCYQLYASESDRAHYTIQTREPETWMQMDVSSFVWTDLYKHLVT